MILTGAIKQSIDKSILCWLATVSDAGMPNVSPKEIFQYYREDRVIIANIASPQSIKNIKQNPNICVSFIDILVQKGYQLKGQATVVESNHPEYADMEASLLKMTGGNYPFKHIIVITVSSSKPIIAPKYLLYPETTEQDQVAAAKKQYGLD